MSAVPVFQRILKWGGVLAVAIAVIGGGVGFLTSGSPGLVSALVGTAMSILFMGITAASILLALRVSNDPAAIGAFFGIVMGGWLVKFVVFLIIIFAAFYYHIIDSRTPVFSYHCVCYRAREILFFTH